LYLIYSRGNDGPLQGESGEPEETSVGRIQKGTPLKPDAQNPQEVDERGVLEDKRKKDLRR
jgi:hypothetical protein